METGNESLQQKMSSSRSMWNITGFFVSEARSGFWWKSSTKRFDMYSGWLEGKYRKTSVHIFNCQYNDFNIGMERLKCGALP